MGHAANVRGDAGFTLYEISARPWLHELQEKYGAKQVATLADVPDGELDRLQRYSVHMLWVQGVWSLGEFGLAMDREESGRVQAYHEALPGFTADDIIGSPYAVTDYVVSEQLGGGSALKALRRRLRERGIGLMLDLVPNHTAVDGVWAGDERCREFFVRRPLSAANGAATAPQLEGEFMANGIAHGRDPYCGAWPDTAQLNYFNPQLRRAMTDVLLRIATQCDALRVDMAMLLLNDVHERCWANVLAAGGWRRPRTEFWADAIRALRAEHPHTVLMAEVYWDMDEQLISLGFDYTYDKSVYDIVRSGHLDNLRANLSRRSAFHHRAVHFTENHDEPRAVREFGGKMAANAAAALLFTLPGIRLQFHGQWEGRANRLDVHLRRALHETADDKNALYYERLNGVLSADIFRHGEWRLVDVGNGASGGARDVWRLLAMHWTLGAERRLIVVNYSDGEAGGYVRLNDVQSKGDVQVEELLGREVYVRKAEDMSSPGLMVWLGAWRVQIFAYQ